MSDAKGGFVPLTAGVGLKGGEKLDHGRSQKSKELGGGEVTVLNRCLRERRKRGRISVSSYVRVWGCGDWRRILER